MSCVVAEIIFPLAIGQRFFAQEPALAPLGLQPAKQIQIRLPILSANAVLTLPKKALATIASKLYNLGRLEVRVPVASWKYRVLVVAGREASSKEKIMDRKKPVVVRVPENMTLEQAQHALASVLNKVGHPNCYSGFNINFVNMGDPAPMVLNAEGGKVVEAD